MTRSARNDEHRDADALWHERFERDPINYETWEYGDMHEFTIEGPLVRASAEFFRLRAICAGMERAWTEAAFWQTQHCAALAAIEQAESLECELAGRRLVQ